MNPLHYFEINNIGGCAMPRSAKNIQWLKKKGISAILTLTERSLPADWLNDFISLHIPVCDFTAPTIDQLNFCVDFLDSCIKVNKKPVVHCLMGYGRTGTILAAFLISKGLSANEAISKVRQKRYGAIETIEQEDILFEFEAEKNSH